MALAMIGLTLILRWLLNPVLGERVPYLLLFSALLVLVLLVRPMPFIVAALAGGIGCWSLFIRPAADPAAPLALLQLALFSLAAAAAGITAWLSTRSQQRLRLACRETEEQREALRVTLASIADAVITTDTRGRVTFMNPVAESITGRISASAEGFDIDEIFRIVDERTLAPLTNPVRTVLDSGQVSGLPNDTLLKRGDGTFTPIDDSAAPIRNADAGVTGAVLVFRDISARRASEEALRASERELADFFENVSIGLHWAGPDGIIQRANRAELELLGRTADEYVGRHIGEFHCDPSVIDHITASLARGEMVREMPARLRRKDATIRDVLINVSGYRVDGRVIQMRCFTLDVTERKRAEQALRESEQRFRLMADAAPVLIWMSDATNARVWFNRTWLEFAGRPIDRELGSGWRDNVHADDLDDCIRTTVQRVDARQRFSVEYRMRRGDGEYRWMQDDGVPRYDAEGVFSGYIGSCIDITDRHQAATRLQDADRRKDEFLATLAHELRNPLAPIRNSLEILRRAENDGHALRRARDTMERQLLQLVRLVDELLDVSRISRGRIDLRRETIDLNSVIRQAVEANLGAVERARQELDLTLAPEPLLLQGDPVRLTQVFSNLLDNACKYSQPGGHIALSVEALGGEVTVRVEDTGIGIAADVLPRVFDMFWQRDQSLERTRGGLGIGLTLVQRLVDLHGGSVEAASAGPGRGSTFIVRLPLLAANAPPPGPPATPPVRSHARTILVVDDNQDSAQSLSTLLHLTGNTTRTAADGIEALAVAESFQPEVVLLDIGLPRLNGYEVARRLRDTPWGRRMVLVALSGWGQQSDRDRSASAGFDAHLVKPLDPALLASVLSELSGPPAGPIRPVTN